jgi:hypothetical protein
MSIKGKELSVVKLLNQEVSEFVYEIPPFDVNVEVLIGDKKYRFEPEPDLTIMELAEYVRFGIKMLSLRGSFVYCDNGSYQNYVESSPFFRHLKEV